MSGTLRGSLAAFPLDILLAMLAEAKSTGCLHLSGEAGGQVLEITAGAPTGASSGASTGEAALAALLAIDEAEFEFVPGPTGAPNLSTRVQDLRTRIRAAREKRQVPSLAGPGPATLRLRALKGVLAPLVPEERTIVGINVLGPEQARPDPSPEPLWSPQHLAALLNAMLYLFLGSDAKRRRDEAEALVASARSKVAGFEGSLPLRKDGLDAEALAGVAHQRAPVVALLHAMIREHFDDVVRVQGSSHVQRAYAAAVQHTLGPGEALLRDALRIAGAGTGLRAKLTVTAGGTEAPIHLDERKHTIGRSASNSVKLDHESVSRRHAQLSPRSGRFVVTDLGSTAGTAVNGERVGGERVLCSGDTITLGDVALRFEHVEE